MGLSLVSIFFFCFHISSVGLCKLSLWKRRAWLCAAVQKLTVTPHNLRDKLKELLEVSSGNLRGVAIRSLTLGEFEERENEQNPRRVTLHYRALKTSKFCGAAHMIITDPLIMPAGCICSTCTHADWGSKAPEAKNFSIVPNQTKQVSKTRHVKSCFLAGFPAQLGMG